MWRHSDFRLLWAAQSISLLGSQITFLAFPLTAAIMLQATPAQMGVLGSMQYAAFPILGLFAGVWVDRRRRRPVLVAANLGRAVLLFLIPMSALLGMLSMELLLVVALVTGVLTVFFDIAYTAVLPTLVKAEALIEGNSKLATSQSITQVAGPSMAGGLVQLLSAPVAIGVDALSFLVSALLLRQIGAPEPKPSAIARHMGREIGDGLQAVLGHPVLRAFALSGAIWNFFGNLAFAVLIVFASRELGLDAGALGLVFSAGSIGALLGALAAGPMVRRVGLGPTIVWTTLIAGGCRLVIPFASGATATTVLVLSTAWFGSSLAVAIANVHSLSLQQTSTSPHLQGRVAATMRVIAWGAIPIGSLLGGFLGSAAGMRPTLTVGAFGLIFSVLPIVCSPIRAMRDP